MFYCFVSGKNRSELLEDSFLRCDFPVCFTLAWLDLCESSGTTIKLHTVPGFLTSVMTNIHSISWKDDSVHTY